MNRVEIYHNGKLNRVETFETSEGAIVFARVYNHMSVDPINGNTYRALLQY